MGLVIVGKVDARTNERIAALYPRSPFAYRFDMSQVLAAGRLALHLVITHIRFC